MQYKVIAIDNDEERVLTSDELKKFNVNIKTSSTCENNILRLHEPIYFDKSTCIFLRGKDTKIEIENCSLGTNFYLLTGQAKKNQSLYIGEG
ncbi:MAG: hypothetical protein K6G01_03670, partial [Eubacterium sp.]|nr:hypothetical protein [Eubacterium sp.]